MFGVESTSKSPGPMFILELRAQWGMAMACDDRYGPIGKLEIINSPI